MKTFEFTWQAEIKKEVMAINANGVDFSTQAFKTKSNVKEFDVVTKYFVLMINEKFETRLHNKSRFESIDKDLYQRECDFIDAVLTVIKNKIIRTQRITNTYDFMYSWQKELTDELTALEKNGLYLFIGSDNPENNPVYSKLFAQTNHHCISLYYDGYIAVEEEIKIENPDSPEYTKEAKFVTAILELFRKKSEQVKKEWKEACIAAQKLAT